MDPAVTKNIQIPPGFPELKVCSLTELATSNSVIRFIETLRDEVIAFRDSEGSVAVFSSVCPHLAGEIILDNGNLRCRWHGLKFNAEGRALNCRAKLSMRKYDSFVRGEDVFIKYEL